MKLISDISINISSSLANNLGDESLVLACHPYNLKVKRSKERKEGKEGEEWNALKRAGMCSHEGGSLLRTSIILGLLFHISNRSTLFCH